MSYIVEKLPNSERIEKKLKKNKGFKLASIRTEDTKCPCKDFREQFSGVCACGLYTKRPLDCIIYTKGTVEHATRYAYLTDMLDTLGMEYLRSTEIPEGIRDEDLPAMEKGNGRIYSYLEALATLVNDAIAMKKTDKFKFKESGYGENNGTISESQLSD